MKRRSNSAHVLAMIFTSCLALSACGPKVTTTPASNEPSGTVLALVGPGGGTLVQHGPIEGTACH